MRRSRAEARHEREAMASSSPTAAALDVSDTDLQDRPSTVPSTASALDQDTDLPATPESPSSDTAVPSTSRYSLNTFHTH